LEGTDDILSRRIAVEEYSIVKEDERFVTDYAKMDLVSARKVFAGAGEGYRLVRVGNYPAYKDKDGDWLFPVVEVLKTK